MEPTAPPQNPPEKREKNISSVLLTLSCIDNSNRHSKCIIYRTHPTAITAGKIVIYCN